MKNNIVLTIDICLQHVDMIDYYITKNIIEIITNKKNFEFIKSNIFLLAVNNKNNKNSLIILLENGKYKIVKELIEYDYKILYYKNIYENNLFKLLLNYDYFYDLILDKINNLEKNFIIKIIISNNKYDNNFIDNLIILLNSNSSYYFYKDNNDNKKILLNKIINITYNIFLLDSEKYTFIISKLCKSIKDENFLLEILKKFNIENLDIYPDLNLFLCIDYLIINEFFEIFLFILDKINYIEFTNIDDNIIFKLCENNNIDINTKSNIIIKILYKSNITKFKNNKNQNIFYWLINEYNINKKIIMNFIDYINIYEQDIYGKTLFDLITEKFSKPDIKQIKTFFSKQYFNKNEFEKIYKKINIKNKLIKSDIGVFTSNIIHNMLYTIYILNTHENIIKIPYFTLSNENKNYYKEQIEISNNEKSLINYINLFFINFNKWLPHLIIWKNKYNYWIDPNLIDSIKKSKSIDFLYIKLSVYLINNTSIRHSNIIIIDNNKKIVERFEPYGEMIFTNTIDINNMIQTQIANQLGYKFIFVQPYPGFQSRSDEFAKFNKSYGDPMGYCLAWSFLYIDIKMELFKNKIDINPIDFINWYIINKFTNDFKIDNNINKTNKYILFIRYYAKYLDLKKNEIIKKFNLNQNLIYLDDMDLDFQNKIIKNINKELDTFC
jgi:hypothetical protein